MEKEMEIGMEKEKNEKKKKESSRLTAAGPDSRKAPHPAAPPLLVKMDKSKRFGPEITSTANSTQKQQKYTLKNVINAINMINIIINVITMIAMITMINKTIIINN